ncbi:uncharacterized protein LOC121378003 isoform X2 [Gigantopelta aegis]|uniref:uncharacterized protein LOC121378003 isoform X2 n=1 Tax=Gigantopelta aegis TaxID=1735272 RepID=UPI001B88E64C|nr:uncharacterized protein LOC121378003 isoform X2 [Gigantopelta aegis]
MAGQVNKKGDFGKIMHLPVLNISPSNDHTLDGEYIQPWRRRDKAQIRDSLPKTKHREESRCTERPSNVTPAKYGSVSCKPKRSVARSFTERTRDAIRPVTVDIPYHTAITQPPAKRNHTPKFDALTRTMVPLPHLYDRSVTTCHPKTDISSWWHQVKKDVPRRPKFAVSALDKSVKLPYFIIDDTFVTNVSGVFRRTDSSGFDKEYSVNPEWASERLHLHGHRAYRTCGIRYGWCF